MSSYNNNYYYDTLSNDEFYLEECDEDYGKTLLCTVLPKAYGTTADEILSNMTSTTITINSTDELAKLESTGGTTSEILSAQLTATVTPENCTQPVVWSVDPTGIVTVNNGLVTAVSNGEATVTATCGSYSDTCAVTVSGIEEQPGDEPTILTKTLTQGKGFNTKTGEVTITGNSAYGICEEYIPVIKGNTYTINGCGTWVTIVGYNSDKTFNKTISIGSGGSTTYEFVNDCNYIRVGCNLTSGTTITITGIFGESGGDAPSGGGTGDYTDISYIESTGTQYINTGIVPTASTKIELVAEMSASKQYDHIFGSDNFMKVQWVDGTGTVIDAVKKNGQNQVSGLTLGKHTYVMDMTDTANVITIDGTKYGTIIGNVESTTYPLLLLSGYSKVGSIETNLCGIGKIYSCKIYYEDTLVANMKPILTNSGTYGLLDTVNNSFYASEVGNFTGPVPPSGGDTLTTM